MPAIDDALLEGIRDADAHRAGIRCLRLFRVDRGVARALRAEVLALCECEAHSDVQEQEHVTHWTRPYGAVSQWSLWNRHGDFADFRDDHDLSCLGKAFHHAARYPVLAELASALPHLINLRINALGPGAGLRPHEEHSVYPDGNGGACVRARFHLPIATSRGARMMLDGDVVRFAPRAVYYFNQGCVHAADNPSDDRRVHLVWDQLLTAEVGRVMFGDDATAPSAAPVPGWTRCLGGERQVRRYARMPVPAHACQPPLATPREANRVRWAAVR